MTARESDLAALPEAEVNGIAVGARDVTRRYGEGATAVDALRGVSLEVGRGELVAVMGPSGSGKSTLMHPLAGLDKSTSGTVTIAGIEVTGLDDARLTRLRRDHIGFVFQFFNLVNMLVLTVFERTRELGMLRVVGLTRHEVRQMIRHESVVTALLGPSIGIPLGVVMALVVGAAIKYAAFTVPVRTLVIFVIAAIVVGVVAAIFPARRAARRNVLEALQYE